MDGERADPDPPRYRIVSTREAALRILAPRFRSFPSERTSIPLADFQRETVARAASILVRRRGVIIADSVGLGKTYVALALIESALMSCQRVLVVVPAALKGMWRSELQKLAVPATDVPRLTTHTRLARGFAASRGMPPSWNLVVVDEAHAFRNARTQRYRALRRLCRGARVVLLTATPVNNSLSDLYFQLRLFCSDSAFRDLGIGSLRFALGKDPRAGDLARLKHAVMVRRTRAEARAALATRAQSSPATVSFRFPRHTVIHAIGYELPIAVAPIRGFLGRLTFSAYRIAAGSAFSSDLLRFAFLKRMESSVATLRTTLHWQIRFHEEFAASLESGRLLRPAVFRKLYRVGDDALQLVLGAVAIDELPTPVEPSAVHDVWADLTVLREWHAALCEVIDHKIQQLCALLATRRGRATVVFSEYRDTARYVWTALRRRFAVGLIDGAGAWIGETPTSRRQVVERFAPRSNGGRAVHPREAIEVLIATDVLAEGMNLQDADAVISYDLPWNPIRLIQRAGRVDRIGAAHDVVQIYNFLPDREFDAFLGLARTLRTKLETVRNSVGIERAVLEPGEDFESVAHSLAAGDADVLDRIDGAREVRLRAEFERHRAQALDGALLIAARPGARGSKVIVGLECGTDWSIALVDAATGEELDGADDALLEALESGDCEPVEPAALVAIARRCRDAQEQTLRDAALVKTSAAARVARKLRERLGELPLSTPPDLYARADTILEQLGSITDISVEEDLAAVARMPDATLADLLTAAETTLARHENSTPAEGNWQITGVISLD